MLIRYGRPKVGHHKLIDCSVCKLQRPLAIGDRLSESAELATDHGAAYIEMRQRHRVRLAGLPRVGCCAKFRELRRIGLLLVQNCTDVGNCSGCNGTLLLGSSGNAYCTESRCRRSVECIVIL